MANYLYNGVELPALPEWDRETYPYVVVLINDWSGDNPALLATKEPLVLRYYEDSYSNGFKYDSHFYCTQTDTGEWSKGFYTDYGGSLVGSYVRWSNHDILYGDNHSGEKGTIYLNGSYPTNAETGEEVTDYGLYHFPVNPPNPTAMLMGYMVGQAIRK